MEIIKHSRQAQRQEQGGGGAEEESRKPSKAHKKCQSRPQNARFDWREREKERERGSEVGGNSLSCFKNSHTKGNAWQYFCLLIYVAAVHGCRKGGRKGRHNVRERVEVAVRGKVKPRKRRHRERERE